MFWTLWVQWPVLSWLPWLRCNCVLITQFAQKVQKIIMIYFDYTITRVIHFHSDHLSGQRDESWCWTPNCPNYIKLFTQSWVILIYPCSFSFAYLHTCTFPVLVMKQLIDTPPVTLRLNSSSSCTNGIGKIIHVFYECSVLYGNPRRKISLIWWTSLRRGG